MKISKEMWDDLRGVMQAMIEKHAERDSEYDGGLIESIRLSKLEDEFEEKHVEKEEDDG